jgi:hypothetical protein
MGAFLDALCSNTAGAACEGSVVVPQIAPAQPERSPAQTLAAHNGLRVMSIAALRRAHALARAGAGSSRSALRAGAQPKINHVPHAVAEGTRDGVGGVDLGQGQDL